MILQAIKTVLSDRDIRILNLRISSKHSQTIIEIGIILSALILMLPYKASSVDTSRHAQVLTKHLEPEEFHFYELSNLKKGDTLWDIANLYKGVSVNDIKKWNNMGSSSKLKIGQKLKIATNG